MAIGGWRRPEVRSQKSEKRIEMKREGETRTGLGSGVWSIGSGKSGRAKKRDAKIGDRRQEPVSPHFHEKEILVFLPLSS